MQADLVPTGEHKASDGHSPIVQFFINIQVLATHNREQVAILFGMLFTLIVWVFSALSLFVAVLFYLLFLCHHIPNIDRGLSNYCRRKIDSRLHKIVGVKVNRALAKVNTDRTGHEASATIDGKMPAQIARQPTLPILDTKPDEKFQHRPPLSRQTTQTTVPPYFSRQPSCTSDHPSRIPYGEPAILEKFPFPRRPLPPSRSTTQSSAFSIASYTYHAPLMGEGAEMGYTPPSPSYAPGLISRMDSDRKVKLPIERSFTVNPQFTQRSHHSAREPPLVPDWRTPGAMQMGPPSRQNTGIRGFELSETQARPPIPHHAFSSNGKISPTGDYWRRNPEPQDSRGTPAQEFEMRPHRPVELSANNEYMAFDPNFHESQSSTSQPSFAPLPARNFTMPIKSYQALQSINQQQQLAPLQRFSTAPISRKPTYNGFPLVSNASTDDDTLPRVKLPLRAATAGPNDGWYGRRRPS